MNGSARVWPAWVLIGLFATIIATSVSDYSMLVPEPQKRYDMHDAIVHGTASSPQRYRVLVPFALDPIITFAAGYTDHDQAFRRVYFAFHFLALTALVGGVYAYSRLWYSRERALIGALIVASTLHLVLRMGEYWDFSPIPERTWFAPWSLLEPVFVSFGLIAIHKRNWVVVGLLAVLAALNSGVPAALVGGVPAFTFDANFAHLPSTAVNLFLFLGPAILLAARGWHEAPGFARRALLAAAPLVAIVFLFGDWWDVRLLTPVYPLITPVMLAGLRSASQIHRPSR